MAIKKGDYNFADMMAGDMADMPMAEEAGAAEEAGPSVDLASVSDEDLLAEAERRGLLEGEAAEAEEPTEEEMM
jgi:hypothetical protein